MFCLPSDADTSGAGDPIGWMHLEPFDADNPQNRCARFAITLNKRYQVTNRHIRGLWIWSS